MLLVSVVFTVVLLAGVLVLTGRFPIASYLTFWAVWTGTFAAYVAVESIRAARAVNRLRVSPGEPNDAPLRLGAEAIASRYRGRVFRSRATLFGLPLLDLNVSDSLPLAGQGQSTPAPRERRVARGWIAVGDDARGILLAVGHTARGLVAVGGRAVGVLSLGGMAVGLVAIGGFALGVVAVGGLGVGVLALGGGALGWQAAGGGAFAWDVAVGGGAVARDYAVGGAAWARCANDDAARTVLLDHPLAHAVQWSVASAVLALASFILFCVLTPLTVFPLMYRRQEPG
jgi:hypothetical protein